MTDWYVIAALAAGGIVASAALFFSTRWLVVKYRGQFEPAIRGTLYARTPVRMRTPLALADAEGRLSREMHPTAPPFARRLVGSVENGKVRLAVHRPLLRNSMAPVLDARFSREDDRTWLTGSFGLDAFVRRFLIFCFWFASFVSAVLLPAGIVGLLIDPSRWALALVIAPPTFLVLTVLLVRFSRWLGTRDEAFALERIRKAISGVVA